MLELGHINDMNNFMNNTDSKADSKYDKLALLRTHDLTIPLNNFANTLELETPPYLTVADPFLVMAVHY
jgi:hypothetical protein